MRRTLFLVVLAISLIAAPTAHADVAPNSGLPGSTCVAAPAPIPYTAPGAGVSTSGFGPDAPAYYEIGRPTGLYEGAAAKGIMLVIHGGSWYMVGKEATSSTRAYSDHWRARGWLTVAVDYRPCAQSIKDVAWFMQRIRMARPNAVICAAGLSAGGHLALLLASYRPDLACVIALAGPSDLNALATQNAKLFNQAAAAFGADPNRLRYVSPISYVPWMRARVLLASSAGDPLVVPAQNEAFAAALRAAQPSLYVDSMTLESGSTYFVHAGISSAALENLLAREQALVAPLVG